MVASAIRGAGEEHRHSKMSEKLSCGQSCSLVVFCEMAESESAMIANLQQKISKLEAEILKVGKHVVAHIGVFLKGLCSFCSLRNN